MGMRMIFKPNEVKQDIYLKSGECYVKIELNSRQEWSGEWSSKHKRWILTRDVFQLSMSPLKLTEYFHPYYNMNKE